jgi:hypothetical protein
MKIRIKGNSLRYRLTISDVRELAGGGYLKDSTTFGNTTLTYALQSAELPYLKATFEQNTITLFIPKTLVNELINTDKVGFDHTDGSLYLLIEKDFTCLDNVAEDQSDNYPNPLASK